MARKTSPRIAPTASPRHFWLAGLGFVSIASRRAVSTAGTAAGRAVRARQDVVAAMQTARSRATTATTELRDRIEAGAERMNAIVGDALSPLIAKLKQGKSKRVVRRGRKPVAKKPRRAAVAKKNVARRTRRG